MRVLECLCWFKVRVHIKNRVLLESVALVYTCIEDCEVIYEMFHILDCGF